MDLLLIRLVFIIVVTTTCWFLHPFGLYGLPAFGAAMLMSAMVVGIRDSAAGG